MSNNINVTIDPFHGSNRGSNPRGDANLIPSLFSKLPSVSREIGAFFHFYTTPEFDRQNPIMTAFTRRAPVPSGEKLVMSHCVSVLGDLA
jgi:hypothetical protein